MANVRFTQHHLPRLNGRFAERRRNPRFPCELPVDCITNESKIHVGIAANISQGGILVYLDDRITVGTPLRIHVVFAQGFQLRVIGANAVVIWGNVARKPFWGNYQYGLRFTEMRGRVCLDFKDLVGELAREFRLKNSFPSG
jgi:hypothetical protein